MEVCMKTLSKFLFAFIALSIIFTAGIKAYGEQNVVDVDYKKWSRIAISSVKEKYPDAELVDYKYDGRVTVNEEESKDVFHVKSKQNDKTFIVKVDVVFNPKTGQLITVNIAEMREGNL